MSHHRHHDHDCTCCSTVPTALDRRRFLGLAAVGAGVVTLGGMVTPRPALAGGRTEALLLTCMDYRLVDDAVRYMGDRKLTNNYDHVVLAGASLGAVTNRFPAWNTTFWEHLETAISLHQIRRVMVMDHRDCGAYKVIFGRDFATDRAAETAAHAEQMNALAKAIRAKHPELAVELLLMSLDGSVEPVASV